MQTHFAHPANRFYPALLRAGILRDPVDPSAGMTDEDRDRFRARGLGITNLVRRATARASELTARRAAHGSRAPATQLVARRRPRVVAVLGITAYRTAFGAAEGRARAVRTSRSRMPSCGCVPNPSGLNAHETIASLAAAYAEPARAAGVVA